LGDVMKKYRSTRKLPSASFLTGLAVLVWGAGVVQNAAVAQERLPTAMVIPATQERARTEDQQLRDKVENALRSDPYFYGAHVNVSVENGSVVLQGFVFSDWDLRDAIRIATKAAGVRVVDNLAIEVGGRR
jgi:osmotically-inducible protein OsmY